MPERLLLCPLRALTEPSAYYLQVDRAARFWVPFVYVALLTTLMSMTLDDTYSSVMRTNNGSDGKFSKQIGAFGHASVSRPLWRCTHLAWVPFPVPH